MSILIIGGGWAGLAAAVRLAQAGQRVTLLESAPHLGGRARTVERHGLALDNGQHLAIGAYRETLALLNGIGVAEDRAFLRLPLCLEQYHPDGRFLLAPPPLPAPLHLGMGLLTARGLPLKERLSALRLSLGWARQRFRLSPDRPLGPWLRQQGQSAASVERLWEPLCLATLNTPLEQASSAVFLRVLQDSFAHRRHDCDLLIPRRPLGEILPQPAQRFLEDHGARVHTRHRVTAVESEDGRVRGVRLDDGRRMAAEGVILALPPHATARLLAPHPPLTPLVSRLQAFHYQPITTVYLGYPQETRAPRLMLGLGGGLGQWLFDRRACGQPGVMAVVISAEGPHRRLSRQALGQRIAEELAAHFPHWPAPLWCDSLTEKRATFACTVAGAQDRPGNSTALTGLWLAGDYTDTGYPATLEGAVRSGTAAAEALLSA